MALLDRCIFLAVSGGTGTFVEASAVTGYQTMEAAAAVDTKTYSYAAQSSDLSQWEYGIGTYSLGGTSLARTTVLGNSLGGTSPINFTNPPQVMLTALNVDFTGGNIETETGTSPIKISAFSTASNPLGPSNTGVGDLVTGLQGGSNVNFTQAELLSSKAAVAASGGHGGNIVGTAGAGDGAGAGGYFLFQAGAGGATGAGGKIQVYAGAGSGTANGGNAYFRSGSPAGSGDGGILYFGAGGASTGYGGNLNFSSGYSQYGGGGGFYAQAGNSGTTAAAGGCYFKSGTSVNQTSAHFYIYGGHGGGGFGAGTFLFAASDNAPPGNGGDIYFKPGTGAAQGRIVFANAVSTPGTSPGTLTNAPAVGDPQTWLAVTINGVDHFIPAWHV